MPETQLCGTGGLPSSDDFLRSPPTACVLLFNFYNRLLNAMLKWHTTKSILGANVEQKNKEIEATFLN